MSAARDRLVLEHLWLVEKIARGFQCPVEMDDLVHEGIMGLMDAVTKFDPSRGVHFSSYASYRIRGSIIDALRKLDWASRDTRRAIRRAEAEGEPVPACAVQLVHVVKTEDGMEFHTPVSGDMPADEVCGREELRGAMQRALGCLSARYQKVMELYYWREMTHKEIGAVLGVNEFRVSQICKRARDKMRVALEACGIDSCQAF
ncbi:MAG TPA: sigma-70 family RNA polymerase sigma factor [Bryobacteraceae bacterium]|jgi:RNA polymerase sigma factor for flagellar operon FliA|nr:sigma-70 family RNA polymerase sigma factor [Bryobacteraceae bacterium]